MQVEFGQRRSLPTIYNLLHRLNYSYLRPRPRHDLADPIKQQAFLAALPQQLEQIALAYPSKRLRIYFQDEARFGQQGTTTNVWAKTGSRPSAVRQTAYQYVWVMAAVCERDRPQRWPARAAVGHPLHQHVLKSILTNPGSG